MNLLPVSNSAQSYKSSLGFMLRAKYTGTENHSIRWFGKGINVTLEKSDCL
jgi:hypothetical protein